jgi:GcrA cell cycle regulator
MWTEERIELLIECHRAGLSRQQTANKIGNVTRNAVIGKLARLGFAEPKKHWSDPAPKIRPRNQTKHKRRDAGNSLRIKIRAFSPRFTHGPPKLPAPMPKQHASDVARISYADFIDPSAKVAIPQNACRWPIGEPTAGFCGCDKVPGSSYCESHLARSTASNNKPHDTYRPMMFGITAVKSAEEFLAPEAVA